MSVCGYIGLQKHESCHVRVNLMRTGGHTATCESRGCGSLVLLGGPIPPQLQRPSPVGPVAPRGAPPTESQAGTIGACD